MTAFLKMHGLGNDFVVFDAREHAIDLNAARAKAIADRHFGVGCDTVVVIRPGGAEVDAGILFYNADGSESESCFNATRCVARLLFDERGLTRVKLATKGGTLICSDAGKGLVMLDMGPPRLEWRPKLLPGHSFPHGILPQSASPTNGKRRSFGTVAPESRSITPLSGKTGVRP